MRIAFYAPMKPPNDPKPSGDRRMAQSLVQALELAGNEVFVASRLKSRVANGAKDAQFHVRDCAKKEINTLIDQFQNDPGLRPDLWFSYHVYYKAPDWIGPEISQAIDIPYIIYEASYAPKRRNGPWQPGFEATESAIQGAAQIWSPNAVNDECVRKILPVCAEIIPFPPFLDIAPYREIGTSRGRLGDLLRERAGFAQAAPIIVTTAMMRRGDKAASYKRLAQALEKLADIPWNLAVAGDGPAREEIEGDFARFGDRRIAFLGQIAPADMPAFLAGGDLFAWPAVNEAYGMAILEAQAAGLPVAAGREGGVPGIVRDNKTGLLAEPGDVADFAARLRRLLTEPERRQAMGAAARRAVEDGHSLESAAKRADSLLKELLRSNAA